MTVVRTFWSVGEAPARFVPGSNVTTVGYENLALSLPRYRDSAARCKKIVKYLLQVPPGLDAAQGNLLKSPTPAAGLAAPPAPAP